MNGYSLQNYLLGAGVELSFLAAMIIALLLSPVVHAGETMFIKDKGIEIEAFVFGECSQTLIIAAGNGRPAAGD